MANSRKEALAEIAQGICACFGDADLLFALHSSDKVRADRLKFLTRDWRLNVSDIEAAIRPPIQAWIEGGYFGHGENKPRPWNKDPVARNSKITAMVSEASRELCK